MNVENKSYAPIRGNTNNLLLEKMEKNIGLKNFVTRIEFQFCSALFFLIFSMVNRASLAEDKKKWHQDEQNPDDATGLNGICTELVWIIFFKLCLSCLFARNGESIHFY